MYMIAGDMLPVALFGLGTPEMIVIGLVILLLFGATRIRPLMRSLGGGIRDFKKGMQEGLEDESDDDEVDALEAPRRKRIDADKATEATLLKSEAKKQKV